MLCVRAQLLSPAELVPRSGCCPMRATAAFCGWPAVLRISEGALLQSAERTRHLVVVAEF